MERSGKLLAALLVLTAALLGMGLVVLFDQFDHIALLILIPLMFVIGWIPLIARIWRGQFDLFEVIVPYFAMYFLFYGAGALFMLFVDGIALDPGIRDYVDIAVAYCTLGFACAMIGYSLAGRFVPTYSGGAGPSMGWFALFVLFNLGYAGELIRANLEYIPLGREISISGFATLLQQVSWLTMFSMFYILYMLFLDRGTLGLKVLLFGYMVPLQVMSLFLRFGNKSALMYILGLPLIAYWYARRQIPWKSLIATLCVIVFVVFPVYYAFRSIHGTYYSREMRVARSIEMLQRQEASTYGKESLKTVARRLAIINSTAVVVRDCGNRVEYQMGKTLWDGVVLLAIPRLFWPNKPTTNVCTEFGKIFRMTSFGNFSAVSMSMVGELYWQFHVPGIILGTLVFGIFLRVIYERFGPGAASPIRLALYVPLMYVAALQGEGEIGALIGSVGRMLFVYFIIERGLVALQGIGERRAAGQRVQQAVSTP